MRNFLRAPPSDAGYSAALAHADDNRDALQAPIDLEDRAILRWMGGQALPHFGPQSRKKLHKPPRHWALGDAPLPPLWRAEAEDFTDEADALQFVQPLRHATGALGVVAALIARVDGATADDGAPDTLLRHVARLLASKRLWLIMIRRPPSADVTHADPAIFAAMNVDYNTNIDVQKIAGWEGGQWLHGYIPFNRAGVVIGRSGITVATGFDVGQHTVANLKAMKLRQPTVDKLKPFTHPLSLHGKTHDEVVAMMPHLGPLPLLDKSEADDIDRGSFPGYLEKAIQKWDVARAAGTAGLPAFRQFPAPWQTVMLSREFNQGDWEKVGKPTHAFWLAALAGNWDDAVAKLRAAPFTDRGLRARAVQEADYLATAMPAKLPPKPAAAPGTKP